MERFPSLGTPVLGARDIISQFPGTAWHILVPESALINSNDSNQKKCGAMKVACLAQQNSSEAVWECYADLGNKGVAGFVLRGSARNPPNFVNAWRRVLTGIPPEQAHQTA